MPTIYIDKKPYEVKAGRNLLEACLSLGFDLPYFCWHPALGSVGACRQCAVRLFKDEQDTKGRLVMSCMEEVKDGLLLSISDKTAREFREQIIEWLMTNHPHDCPVCDEGGSCHLQDMTVMTGHNYRRYPYKKRTFHNQYLGPLIHHEMNRCIQCYRCVRFYRDYAGGKDLNVFSAHNHVYFGREKDGILESPFSGNLAEVCPTGVFTDKTLKEHYTRKWDLTTAPSICHHCSLGCNIIAGERYGAIRHIINRFNGEVNGYFLCDRGRFGYDFVNSVNRISQPLIRNRAIDAVDEPTLLEELRNLVTRYTLIGIGSPRASVESNFALMQLVGKENFYQGVTEEEAYLDKRIVDMLSSGAVHSASLKEIEAADAVLVLGEDVWNTAPIMALAIRQAVMRTAANQAGQQLSLPVWNDLAIREFAQDEKGFLANCTVAPSPLDEISTCTVHAAPDSIARLGFAIAHLLDPSLPEVPNLTQSDPSLYDVTNLHQEMASKARTIAETLKQAKSPVIICGTSCYNDALLRAAFDIAAILSTPERKAGLSYVLRECNSMGLAMMRAPSFEAASKKVGIRQDCAAIVLENDIYRTIPEAKADAFFDHCRKIVVFDSLNNHTTARADILIPAASFAEADGTIVNNEGRAQRFFQVFMPTNNASKESWKWLWKLYALRTGKANGHESPPDELLAKLESTLPGFEGISEAAPPKDFRIHGELIAREPHRYSGRTAIQANVAVSELRPPQDVDSPLSFTMEGFQGIPPSPLIPFFWAPGWNSVQSVNKYQQEPGGSLRGGDPGKKLFQKKSTTDTVYFKDIPEEFTTRQQKWLLLPQYHIFGSGEHSNLSKAIRELTPKPYVALSTEDAERMGASENSIIYLRSDEQEYPFSLKIQPGLNNGIILASAGLPGAPALSWGAWVSLRLYKPVPPNPMNPSSQPYEPRSI